MTGTRAGGATLVGERRALAADSVLELIRRVALARPDAIAVASGADAMTFRELWLRAATLAAALTDVGTGPGDLIAIMAERTAETVAAMLAAWAVRAGYVPIDPTNPVSRVRAVLAGAQPRVVLHNGPADPVATGDVPVIDMATIRGQPDTPTWPIAEPAPDDIAYVVFTSGSTGIPKGVQVEHRSLVNYVSWCAALTGVDGLGSPLFASLGFDLALTTLWAPLAHGLSVVAVRNSWDYATVFAQRPEPYAFMKMTPSHARLIERIMRPHYRSATRTLIFGGEALEPSLIAGMAGRLAGVRLINHYGPTEATIGCCAYEFHEAAVPDLPSVPIGRPAWNTSAHVLDSQGRPVRAGAHGELIISGIPVARGYLGQDSSTSFIDARDVGDSGRAYRTGDIVELRPEGVLMYLGRNDDQLKVNGHRVELAELSSHFRSLPGVIDAAFEITQAGPVERIEALVVLDGSPVALDEGSERRMLDRLSAVLPPGLVPHRIHAVPKIVLNANGKRDIPATKRLAGHDEEADPSLSAGNEGERAVPERQRPDLG